MVILCGCNVGGNAGDWGGDVGRGVEEEKFCILYLNKYYQHRLGSYARLGNHGDDDYDDGDDDSSSSSSSSSSTSSSSSSSSSSAWCHV
ncbi:hypothetical protein M0802_009797 [Mischocyttarus mexicanus]|nr:hypothetical protein M0802_009797 [Mischocyttarus mexicanus]